MDLKSGMESKKNKIAPSDGKLKHYLILSFYNIFWGGIS